jgi:ABC-2 type transport system permease protein
VTSRRLLALIRKEILELARDRVMMGFLVYAFTIDVLLVAQGLHLSLSHAGASILDRDRTSTSRELVGRLPQRHFQVRPPPRDEGEMLERLDRGKDLIGLVIPPDFEERVLRGARAPVQLFLDGSQAAHASLAEGYLREVVASLSEERELERLGLAPDAADALPVVESALRVRFNPNRDEAYFMGLNELLWWMALLAVILPASALVREREHGTIEQLLVSPITPWEVLLAKSTASTLLVLGGTAVSVFAILLPVFGVPVRGSLVLFFASSTLFTFTMSGVGMMVASLCRTMPQVGAVSLLVMAPILLLSGSFTAPEAMPLWLERATVLSPLRWFTDVSFGIFLRGAGVRDLAVPILAMTGLGALFFAWGALRFRERFR